MITYKDYEIVLCSNCLQLNIVKKDSSKSYIYCPNCDSEHRILDLVDKEMLIDKTYETVFPEEKINNLSKFSIEINEVNKKINYHKGIKAINGKERNIYDVISKLNNHKEEKKEIINTYRLDYDISSEEKKKYKLFKNNTEIKYEENFVINILNNDVLDLFSDTLKKELKILLSRAGNIYNMIYFLFNNNPIIIELFAKADLILDIFDNYNMYVSYKRELNKKGTDLKSILGVSNNTINKLKKENSDEEGIILNTNFFNTLYYFQGNKEINIDDYFKLKNEYFEINNNLLNLYRDQRHYYLNIDENVVDSLKICKKNNIKLDKFISYIKDELIAHQGYMCLPDIIKDYLNYFKYSAYLNTKIEKYPKNLKTELLKAQNQYTLNLEEINNRKFKEAYKENKKYNWSPENLNYNIISPTSIQDIQEAGKKLNNCVASYVTAYLEGKSKIYFLVKKKEPDHLIGCIELNSCNNIVQEKGNSNRPLNKSQKEFMRKWEDYIFEINNKEEKENNKEEIKKAV